MVVLNKIIKNNNKYALCPKGNIYFLIPKIWFLDTNKNGPPV
ncbi:MAG: hypothetical protein ACI9VN_000637, partial [Patescibacteria group bacterium]